MVAAFLKLGIPTMMSALPRRAISSRIAGVRAVWGTSPPYHHGAALALPRARPATPVIRSPCVCTFPVGDASRMCDAPRMHIRSADGVRPQHRDVCSRGAYRTRRASRAPNVHTRPTPVDTTGPAQGGAPPLPTRDRHRRPVVADGARPVSAVGAAEAQVAEADRPPRPDPGLDRRP